VAPAVTKSAQAFRTISEVATDLDVPQHVLRFWESKFNQVKPMKRGGGRRYYRPEDVDLLRGIRILLYEDGFTIKGVQKVFRERGVRFVMDTGAQPDGVRPSLVQDEGARPMSYVEDVSSHADDTPAAGPTRIISPVRDLSADQRQKLNEVLAELLELKGLIQAARGAETLVRAQPQRVAS
jgi:DNA-binding transcriptional MerR regulator